MITILFSLRYHMCACPIPTQGLGVLTREEKTNFDYNSQYPQPSAPHLVNQYAAEFVAEISETDKDSNNMISSFHRPFTKLGKMFGAPHFEMVLFHTVTTFCKQYHQKRQYRPALGFIGLGTYEDGRGQKRFKGTKTLFQASQFPRAMALHLFTILKLNV